MNRSTCLRLVSLLIILLPGLLSAADLSRRTHLGLQFDLSDREGPGLLVAQVLPESTATIAGIRPGDRLTSVGQVQVLSQFDELRAELARLSPGDRIPLRWYRGANRVYRVAPPLVALPREEMPESLVAYETVTVDGISQRLILSVPLAHEPKGLVFYLSDLDCRSHDYWFETRSPIKQLLDGWAGAGFATARLEKRGEGDSEGPDCSALGFADERRGYVAALQRLAERGFEERVFLFGHGLGGIIAPLVITEAVAGVMVYGTVSQPWLDYLLDNLESQDQLAGLPDAAVAERRRLRMAFQQGLLGGESPATLVQRLPDSRSLPDVQDGDHYLGRAVPFYAELAAVQPERAWRQVWQPVLALHGEFDWLSARADHEQIARLTGGKFQSLPGLDHDFLRYESLTESFTAQGTGRPAEDVVQASLAWLATQVAETAPGG